MSQKDKKRIVLLDSHAILHRAYHALPDFSSSRGEPTGALYGLSSMLISIIKELKPDHLIAAFDLPKPTYRHEAYTDYKAGRKASDPELISQIKRAYDLYSAFGIPVYQKEGYEADDVLGTLSEKLKKDAEIIIASGDMDTLQLVDGKNVKVFTLKKGIKDTIIYDEDGVFNRFGFSPNLLPDYKGLRGDPSDNIIGISGIGEKTATILISKIGSIENIYNTLEKSPEKILEIGIKERIINLLKENREEAEFSKMLATIRKDVPVEFEIPEKNWSETVSVQKIQDFFKDLEFRSLNLRLKEILIVPENSSDSFSENIQKNNLEDKKINQIISSEAKIALWLINSSITNPQLEDVFNYTREQDIEIAHKKILKEIFEKKLDYVFYNIEKPLIPIISDMEKNGVKVDLNFLNNLSIEYHKELKKYEKNIWDFAGQEFNINSPQQLSEILFTKLNLKYKGMRKTSTGKLSTREDVLQKLKGSHKIIDEILEYREFQKLLSTYIDAIPKSVANDGRLHANFLQTGTTTGRMSSNNPNLQNIPIGTDRGREIRKSFVAEKGKLLLAFDYSQIELRIAAILSEDKKLIEVFKNGEDIHTNVASAIFGVEKQNVDKEMRRKAKIINFGILYGMGVNALKDGIGSDRQTAQKFYNDYFSIYTDLFKYLEKTKEFARKNGYTETIFGRRRYFDGFKSSIPYIRAQAERMAINAPIQGTQADLIKMSMVKIDQYLKKQNLDKDVKLILQIHDEVIYEVSENVIDKIVLDIKKIMQSVLTKEKSLGVPIISEFSIGKNWGEMEKK
ncbi:MAG TPA: DNA polymerase [Candidatus Paceibacterota bacterium]|nr:DNA polymerase [Candidatus Paceibacterota bacterium]HMP18977.1 DNA polymerase [Candidatus Paceibacterota bacterium]HMP85407.1 DNA polymerase [Candidatus Paceibacterota bacterium]